MRGPQATDPLEAPPPTDTRLVNHRVVPKSVADELVADVRRQIEGLERELVGARNELEAATERHHRPRVDTAQDPAAERLLRMAEQIRAEAEAEAARMLRDARAGIDGAGGATAIADRHIATQAWFWLSADVAGDVTG